MKKGLEQYPLSGWKGWEESLLWEGDSETVYKDSERLRDAALNRQTQATAERERERGNLQIAVSLPVRQLTLGGIQSLIRKSGELYHSFSESVE